MGRDDSYAKQHIKRLEVESASPTDAALEHPKKFAKIEEFRIGGDAKARIAPDIIAMLYHSGRTATRELE